nr:DUF982 domain-containing protein [Mesorhizobium sp. WSM3224]
MVLATGIGEDPPAGRPLEVNNVQAAAENLLEWPKRGRNRNKAVQAYLAALAGESSRRCAHRVRGCGKGRGHAARLIGLILTPS